jgi:hypothetical protein
MGVGVAMILCGLGSPPSALPGISPSRGEIDLWQPPDQLKRRDFGDV